MSEYQLLVSKFLVSCNFVLSFPNMYCSMIRKLICLHFLDLMCQAVTKAKLGYDPVEVNPEDMVRFAKEKPQVWSD